MTLITIDHLTRDFGDIRALDNVSLEIPAGAIFGILGPNGSGKTTLFHLLLGLLEPTAGEVQVLGCDPVRQGEAVRANVGTLLEHHGLYERLTAVENLTFYGRINHMPDSAITERTESLLTAMNLWQRRHEPVRRWSRGMKQRLAIVRAMFHQPPLILLDEPTAGLDPVVATAVRDDLSTLAQQEGSTLLLNTHNLAEAEKLCDTIAILQMGKLLAVEKVAHLHNKAGTITIYGTGFTPPLLPALAALPMVAATEAAPDCLRIGLNEGEDLTPLLCVLIDFGVVIYDIKRSNLEDYFFHLVGV